MIIGPDEMEAGTVSVKNLLVGKKKRSASEDHEQYVKAGKAGQVTVAREELAATVLEMLGTD